MSLTSGAGDACPAQSSRTMEDTRYTDAELLGIIYSYCSEMAEVKKDELRLYHLGENTVKKVIARIICRHKEFKK